MNKKIIIFIFSLIITILAVWSNLIQFPSSERFAFYPIELNKAVEAISKVPEARHLLKNVQKEGKIGILLKQIPGADFNAYWDCKNRVIILNPKRNPNINTQISSILFELHNASTDSQFLQLSNEAYDGQIDRNTYVRKMEWIEHQNTLKTGEILKIGQKMGVFSQNIIWKFPQDFNTHFKRQLETGHASWHAKNYDLLVT